MTQTTITNTANATCATTPAGNDTLHRIKALLQENWPYRRSTSSWAGGDHNVYVRLSEEPCGECYSKRAWSKNGKWSGTSSFADLRITQRCIDALGENLFIGGLITLDAEVIAPRTYRATWLEQSRGVSLKIVQGWIIKGHHCTAKTLEKAKKQVAKARASQVLAIFNNRAALRKLDFTHFPLHQIMVTRGDSLNAGNCIPGTDSFIRTHFGDKGNPKAVSALSLLAIVDDSFVRRAILEADARQRQTAS